MTLSEALRAEGIEPGRVNWLAVEPLCLGLKRGEGGEPYNRCRFEKALNIRTHAENRRACAQLAEGESPPGLTSTKTTSRTVIVGAGSRITTIDENTGPTSKQDLRAMRQGTIARCMLELGWNSADDWRLGRRPASTVIIQQGGY